MPLKTVQTALLEVLAQWGCPQAIKVDNGRPFGDPGSDVIPVLALWLIGLGIDMIWNRPRCPTDNAKVERMQGVTANWAEPAHCATLERLQQQLDQATEIQRNQYRVRRLQGQRRSEAYPDLLAGGRAYQADAFDLKRILAFLAQGNWVRKVSKVGQIAFYNQRWQIGARYRKQRVCIRLDAASLQWVVSDEDGHAIKRFSAGFICRDNIWGLSLCQRTKDG